MAFTEGEWISYISNDGATRYILADRKDGKAPTVICRLVDGTQEDSLLIRAAPEFYRACKLAMEVGAKQGQGIFGWFRDMEKAIAKVEGKHD